MDEFIKIGFALFTLTAMEIVLGIDNIVFIAILTGRLPKQQQPKARLLGLTLALVMRILLLLTLKWILGLEAAIFELGNYLPLHDGLLRTLYEWLIHPEHSKVNEVSWRDLILIGGGLFLIGKSVFEIHEQTARIEQAHGEQKPTITFASALVQIALLDIIFSLDSVITAVGMADEIWVMVVAIVIAIGVMMIFAEKVSHFVEENPTLKMLALSFLILIGVMLVADGSGTHFNKGYVYFAMVFALMVEMLNLRAQSRQRHVAADTA